jgi:hypothetical protein
MILEAALNLKRAEFKEQIPYRILDKPSLGSDETSFEINWKNLRKIKARPNIF